jgi:hypothetical protein
VGGSEQLSDPCAATRSARCWTVMISLDLYRTTSEGTQWVGTFADLDIANAKLTELGEAIPGDYSIFEQSTGERLFYQDGSCPNLEDKPSARFGGA